MPHIGRQLFLRTGILQVEKGINLKKGAFFLAYNVQQPENYAVIKQKK